MKYQNLILIISLILLGCNENSLKTDYIDYHRMINQAESYIQNENYEKALKIYQTLLKNYHHAFYKDIHNACICAIKLKNFKEAYQQACKLVEYGYEMKDFENEAFKELKKHKLWERFVIIYPKVRQKYIKGLNIDTRNKYLELRKKDIYITETLKNTQLQDSLYNLISNDLLKEIQSNGFPPFMYKKDSIASKVYITMRHICGFANAAKNNEKAYSDVKYINGGYIVKDIASKALKEGYITPSMYIEITTYNDYNPYGTIGIQIDFEKEKVYPIIPRVSIAELKAINKRRDSIGLFIINTEDSQLRLIEDYKGYPFEKIKNKLTSSKSSQDIIRLIIEGESEYLQNQKKSVFKLNSNNYKGIYYKGI